MKPPVDWSPCQQKGEEHEWQHKYWAFNWDMYECTKCGICISELGNYG
jgi:ferredoxin